MLKSIFCKYNFLCYFIILYTILSPIVALAGSDNISQKGLHFSQEYSQTLAVPDCSVRSINLG